MKKMFAIVAFVAGLFAVPAMASEKGATVEVGTQSKAYAGKKDKAYWTRVWYQNQARKGKRYKRKASKRRRATKRSTRRASRRSGVVARVSLSRQRMNVYQNGVLRHTWKVSTGRSGYGTPRGTWRIHRMHKRYFSKKYNGAPMPYAMFYYRGFAIHGTNSIKRLGRRASHGCVRLHPSNAAKLFAMVRRSGGTVKVVN